MQLVLKLLEVSVGWDTIWDTDSDTLWGTGSDTLRDDTLLLSLSRLTISGGVLGGGDTSSTELLLEEFTFLTKSLTFLNCSTATSLGISPVITLLLKFWEIASHMFWFVKLSGDFPILLA